MRTLHLRLDLVAVASKRSGLSALAASAMPFVKAASGSGAEGFVRADAWLRWGHLLTPIHILSA